MQELWQLYDDQARPIAGQGAPKDEVFEQGLLHGASHVWIWRRVDDDIEILLQKRSATKRTWPNCYDISAAGHIDLGEDPLTAAIRVTQEEIGLTIQQSDLKCIAMLRDNTQTHGGLIENEYCWLYTLELGQELDFVLQDSEVASLLWMSLSDFAKRYTEDDFVPHNDTYYQTVIYALELIP
jgi:isopentenyldiphosphate isomerase